jgi:nitrite reductase (NADH) small subunit
MTAVAKIHEVPDFGKKVINVSGREILVIRIRHDVFAAENECPHQGSPLTAAIVRDGYISCPRHGYRFNLRDGACPDHPGCTLKVYPVQLSGDDILIDLA